MIFLFIAEGCTACKESLVLDVKEKFPAVKVLQNRLNTTTKVYEVYENGMLVSASPVTDTPCLYFMDSGELYTGKTAIYNKLEKNTNASK